MYIRLYEGYQSLVCSFFRAFRLSICRLICLFNRDHVKDSKRVVVCDVIGHCWSPGQLLYPYRHHLTNQFAKSSRTPETIDPGHITQPGHIVDPHQLYSGGKLLEV